MFSRDICHPEGASSEDLVPVQRGCMKRTKGAGAEGPGMQSARAEGAQWERPPKGFSFEKPTKVLHERKNQYFGPCHPEGPKAVLKHYLWKALPFPSYP